MKNDVKEKKETSIGTKILIIGALLFVLFMFSSCAALFVAVGNFDYAEGNVAVIPITGVITTEADGFGGGFAISDDIIASLEDARDDNNIKAVILEINSPGGSPVPSDDIARAVRSVRAQNKTVVAWVRDVGASGAYWIASSTDHIVANRMSITGSIGVTSSYLGFEEFIDDWNVSYRRFVSGEMKDVGTPFREMTPNEEKFMQEKINRIHREFVAEIARNRNLSVERVDVLATGEYFLGSEALDVGLIDELGGLEEALAFIESAEDITASPTRFEKEKSFFEQLASLQVTINTPVPETGLQMRT